MVALLTNLLITYFQTQNHQSESGAFFKEYRSIGRSADGNLQDPSVVKAHRLLSMQRRSYSSLEIYKRVFKFRESAIILSKGKL